MPKTFRNPQTVEAQILAIKELQRQQKEIGEQIDILKGDLKSFMDKEGLEELSGTDHYISYVEVVKTLFNSKEFSKDYEDLYRKYCYESSSKPFNIRG